MSHNWFSLQRAEFPIQKKFAKWEIKWIPAAVFQNGFSSNQLLYSRLNPATKLTFTRKWKKQKKLIFTLAHEVVTIPGNVVRFLNPESLSGEQYSWNDLNGNGIYEASEKGSLLRRFGGAYHKSDDWDTPVYEELAMGYETALSTFWNMIVVADLRWYRNLLKVHADSQTSAGYIKTSYPESRQGYVYDRVSGYGNETYLLGNNQTDSYYASLEINFLRKKRTSFWDTSLGAGAYFQVAAPPPGNGPWINDIGYISEDTADKNAEVASLARTDYDRGYMLHWITNFYFGNITWSHLFRYRDGEPLGDTLIADGLSQGPVVIQDEQRARGYEGISRFTFYLTWDTKLSYTYKNFTFGLEINNIMDSRTELLERYLRDKYFRRPYEMIPPRSLSLSVKWNW
ncbi:MAG: hypothetical protein D6767_06265 [Candidatus Hydrogenedentota bacterium]|nr:MAG: hypothetical protein D6767_06265 [Candidatus Hydrogenedentota bacterium]